MSYSNKISASFDPTLYQGVWDANTNTPAIASGVGIQGSYYIVNVPGATVIDGHGPWGTGDWIIFNGLTWDQVDYPSGALVWQRVGSVISPAVGTDSLELGNDVEVTDATKGVILTSATKRWRITTRKVG